VFPCFRNFNMFSFNHVNGMFCSLKMLGHIVLANNSSTLADNSRIGFVRHEGSSGGSDMWVRE